MHFEGEFSVPGKATEVIRRFSDVPRMASCMPGAILEPQAEDGSWPGAMVRWRSAQRRSSFKGRVVATFDQDALTGSLQGRGAADMRAARIGVKVNFTLHDNLAVLPPSTIVKIVSDAELGGVLADFARSGGVAVANVIMADFAQRASAEFAKDEVPPDAPLPTDVAGADTGLSAGTAHTQHPMPSSAPPAPLSAHRLLWAVLKAQLARIGKWLGLAR